MLNFVICDDNNPVRIKLAQMLNRIFISHNLDHSIVYSSTNGEDIINYLSNNKVDVLLIDVELNSDISGLQIADIFRKINKNAYIIFLSGYMDYVFESLKSKIFDYLLKPITYEKLEKCILRLENDVVNYNSNFVTLGSNKLLVKQDDINFIEKEKMKAIIYTDCSNFETYASLEKLKLCLSDNFIRCHKSYIANRNKITYADFNSDIILFKNKRTCPIGLKYKSTVMEEIHFGHNNSFFNNAQRDAV